MNTKTLTYCYPTSPMAKKIGLPKTGAWVVQANGKLYAATPDKDTAIKMVQHLPGSYTWDSFTPAKHPWHFGL